MNNTLEFPIKEIDGTEYMYIDKLQLGDITYKLPDIIEIPADLNEDETIKCIVLKLCTYYGYGIDILTDAEFDRKDNAINDILEIDGYLIPSRISLRVVKPFKPDYKVYFNILNAMAEHYEWSTIFEVDKDDE